MASKQRQHENAASQAGRKSCSQAEGKADAKAQGQEWA